jgi:ABC-type sulfate/molybdate transport systems ATPase subunit
MVPVTIEAGEVHHNGEPLGLDPQGLESGAAQLFARPHDLVIVPSTGEHRLRGVVRRVHGIGPARRVEIALEGQSAETLIEVDALRAQPVRIGERVGVRPEQYRLFRAAV